MSTKKENSDRCLAVDQITRRHLMALSTAICASSLVPGSLWALGKTSLLQLSYLTGLSAAANRQSGVERLLWETTKRTSILADELPVDVRLTQDELYQFPLMIWCGQGEILKTHESELNRLRHFLRLGGMLFVDDASPMGDDRFHKSFGLWLNTFWNEERLKPMNKSHTFYKSFYLLNGSRGRLNRDPRLYAVDFEDRSPIIYGRNDLFGALTRDKSGGWSLPMRSLGNRGREWAFRFGVNLLMYATCLNYKRDQVHVPELLKRRKWRVE